MGFLTWRFAISYSGRFWLSILCWIFIIPIVLYIAKCFYSIISFDWNNGDWSYASNSLEAKLRLTVPLPGSGNALIDHKPVEHAEKTLGAMTSPDGNSAAAISMMQEKAQQWIDAVRNGHLHCRNVWFSLKVQFWPRIG